MRGFLAQASGGHFLVRARRVKQAKIARTKWWKLEGEASKVFKEKVIEEDPWNDEGDANSMWRRCQHAFRRLLQRCLE